jgi:hypothetical protein
MTQNPWDDLYPTRISVSDSSNPWPIMTSRVEIDLREEMHKLLYGAPDEIAKGRIGLIRVVRRDVDGNPIKCLCRDSITDEPDEDFYCRTCLGMGFLWDERKIVYYKDDDTLSKKDEVYFYMEYFENPRSSDWIIELKRDEEGRPIAPLTRELYYKNMKVDAFRSDTGRIEYWRCRAELEKQWSIWYGNTSRQHEPTTRI